MWNPRKIWKEKGSTKSPRPHPFHCHASAMDLPRYLRATEDQPRPAAGDHRQLMLQGFEAVAILEAGAGAQDPHLGQLVGFGDL